MGLLEGVLLASAPGLFWLWFFWRSDRWEPEPKTKVVKLFFWGALAAAPAWLCEALIPARAGGFLDAFVRVALTEEVFKLLPVLWIAFRDAEFDEPMDGIVYAVAAALGFATVENALYAMHLGPRLLFFRAFTTTLAHVGFAGVVGFGLGQARFAARRKAATVLAALLAAVALHGLYDSLLAFSVAPGSPESVGRWAVALVIPALLVLLWAVTRRALAASPFRRDQVGETTSHR